MDGHQWPFSAYCLNGSTKSKCRHGFSQSPLLFSIHVFFFFAHPRRSIPKQLWHLVQKATRVSVAWKWNPHNRMGEVAQWRRRQMRGTMIGRGDNWHIIFVNGMVINICASKILWLIDENCIFCKFWNLILFELYKRHNPQFKDRKNRANMWNI